MAVLTTFLRGVLQAGRLVLREPLPARPEPEAVAVLEAAFRRHALDVAGSAISFDAPTALAAGRVLYQAGWYMLNPNLPVDGASLTMPAGPQTAAQHLSADLMLRYLPILFRRARALRPEDELAGCLAEVFRRWPLSGVLADVEDGPLTPPDFDGHAGLRLFYAERLARHEKPGWFPTGAGIEAVELVWHDLGRDTSVLPLAQQVAGALAEHKS